MENLELLDDRFCEAISSHNAVEVNTVDDQLNLICDSTMDTTIDFS
ncbi:MAG: Elf-1-N domain-containing protein [Candidatus Midichloria mitochondrii]|uniref:Uncharacterized protein n=1 Tax=Midichloria mitochondrii (strain IricVA) TaxID=696127 RepID=F7XUU2_MIDMI|nr:hypothetical protein [Candidatus Midichloria mitochondrii]AEI88441.1 hypothetical protein midi_00120 [Candidatus Midichloria mitochondrii IricVA]MDJ1256198.1 hypothetical protein [Candidatus Midichloria mitochondrii]MDJ1287872.1 hypothetical protein [Candidatus Midichloria mitochondrii]MDJ1298760.1 hypothetical protein [Candidatus Midichloria mitochondrii]MDJ1312914.1 hypothetical protein [Candidatus Midichloria mitochondrii]